MNHFKNVNGQKNSKLETQGSQRLEPLILYQADTGGSKSDGCENGAAADLFHFVDAEFVHGVLFHVGIRQNRPWPKPTESVTPS